jgi:hypothetical protein
MLSKILVSTAYRPAWDVPEKVPLGTAMPTASTSRASTQSTRSTQEKCCSLRTAAEKKVLLALFEPDVVLVDVMARAGDHERAQELRRTIDVVWRLIRRAPAKSILVPQSSSRS